MKAIVYKSTGSWYTIKKEDGIFVQARLRGRMKTEGITTTNPVAVGDWVLVSDTGDGDFMIEDIVDRDNYIIRESPQNRNHRHVIGANLDQCLLLVSLKSPRTSTGFIDRFLVVSEAYHIPTIIIFNKSDIYQDKEMEQYENIASLYRSIGYQVHLISVNKNEGLTPFSDILSGKQSLLSGHSGVGKSTFINHFIGGDIKTQKVSGWSGKGLHTTTFAEMYDLENGGRIIDTPGIRELAVTDDIEPTEISHYFKEMLPLIGQCKFNNCVHYNEPGCAIKAAVSQGVISEERYISYLKILDK